MTTKEIAQTVLDQIKATDRAALMAWGSKNFTALSEKKIGEKLQLGGVMFKVNGLKFRGIVIVRLMANDTYEIEIGRVVKFDWKSKQIVDDVYCDQLVQIIDALIEKKGQQVA